MEDREIYFLFTDTGTYLSKAINFFTKQELNHVSISFDEDFRTLYSFGRKQPKNPFIGGFILEDIKNEFLAKSDCAVYRHKISRQDYEKMMEKIKEIEMMKEEYRYNFIGLIGVLFQVKIKRRAALFCSQFVAIVIKESDKFILEKPDCFITPSDIRHHPGNELIYRGKLCDYQPGMQTIVLEEDKSIKQSFVFHLSNTFKRFVIK